MMIGEKTFGKGVVQYFFPLGDGSGLKLTVAKYLTPKMYDITKHGGLTPDIYCKDYPRGELGQGWPLDMLSKYLPALCRRCVGASSRSIKRESSPIH